MISARADASEHRRSCRRPSARPAPAPSQSKIGGTAGPAATLREFADWAAGVGRALTELIFQLAGAKLTRSRNNSYWVQSAQRGALTQEGLDRVQQVGGASGHRPVVAPVPRKGRT